MCWHIRQPPQSKSVHLLFPPLRLQAQCLLLAHVPSEDSEWSRDGSCPDFSQGISLFVQILLAMAPWLQSTRLRAGVSYGRCAGPVGGDTAQLCLRAALGQSCVLSSCVIAVSGCSQRSSKEVFGLQGSGLRQELVFHWGYRCCSKWEMQGGKMSTSVECPTPWVQSSSDFAAS